MTHRTMLTIAGVVVVVAAAGTACDRGRLRGAHVQHGHAFAHVERALDTVDASDVQRARARTILSKALTDLEPWPHAMDRLRADLAAAWRSEAPDRDELHRRVDHEIEALRMLGHALVDDGLALHGVLTSEQRRRLLRIARPR
jgi:hypothetical protein